MVTEYTACKINKSSFDSVYCRYLSRYFPNAE